MKILQLCKKFPWPLKDGESLAVNAISKGLAERNVKMELLAMNTSKHFTTVNSEVIHALGHYEKVNWVPVNTDLKIREAVGSLLEGSSYHLKRFQNEDFEKAVIETLTKTHKPFDFVLLESLYMVPYLETVRKHSDAKILLRSHNLEWEIWDRLAQNNRNPAMKWYLRLLSRKLKEYEMGKIPDVDYLLPISSADLTKYRHLGYQGEAYALPMGIDPDRYPVSGLSRREVIDIAFIGSLDWRPNLEGVRWFMKKVWPVIQKEHEGRFRIHLAGRNMPEKITKMAAGDIVIHGEVDDAIDYMKKYDYFIVPLFSGSGMRVKILEAMAMGKIVISTKVGIEGIPATDGKEYIPADDKNSFISAFRAIASGEYDRKIIGRNARSFIEDNYSEKIISDKLYNFLTEISTRSLEKVR